MAELLSQQEIEAAQRGISAAEILYEDLVNNDKAEWRRAVDARVARNQEDVMREAVKELNAEIERLARARAYLAARTDVENPWDHAAAVRASNVFAARIRKQLGFLVTAGVEEF